MELTADYLFTAARISLTVSKIFMFSFGAERDEWRSTAGRHVYAKDATTIEACRHRRYSDSSKLKTS